MRMFAEFTGWRLGNSTHFRLLAPKADHCWIVFSIQQSQAKTEINGRSLSLRNTICGVNDNGENRVSESPMIHSGVSRAIPNHPAPISQCCPNQRVSCWRKLANISPPRAWRRRMWLRFPIPWRAAFVRASLLRLVLCHRPNYGNWLSGVGFEPLRPSRCRVEVGPRQKAPIARTLVDRGESPPVPYSSIESPPKGFGSERRSKTAAPQIAWRRERHSAASSLRSA